MKIPPSNPLVNKFLAASKGTLDSGGKDAPDLLERLISGIIFLEKPSSNKIHNASITGAKKRSFYNHIHAVAQQMPAIFRQVLANLQKNPKLAMQPGGILIIDEHIVPHTSKEIEGVDKFYSTTERGVILGISLLAVHYYSERVEYPADFSFYRHLRELEGRGDAAEFEKKNELTREFFDRFAAMVGAPSPWVMDAFFMTKENAGRLRFLHKTYISRPKRNWKCTYKGKQHHVSEICDAIPSGDFKLTQVVNPKTRKRKFYHCATIDVSIPRIGKHRLVIVQVGEAPIEGDLLEADPEVLEAPSKKKFRAFCTNCLEWDASYILSTYSLRWGIETSFQDLNQNLALHGCKWRELSGQECFLALAYLCYLFLGWAQAHGELARYGVKRGTLGQAREAFRSYCQEQFTEWLAELKRRCEDCPPANYIYAHLYGGEGEK